MRLSAHLLTFLGDFLRRSNFIFSAVKRKIASSQNPPRNDNLNNIFLIPVIFLQRFQHRFFLFDNRDHFAFLVIV